MFVVLSMVLMVLSTRYPQYSPTHLSLLQHMSAHVKTQFHTQAELQKENSVLQEALLRAQVELQEWQGRINDDVSLRALLKLQTTLPSHSIAAQLSMLPTNNYVIDKGSRDHVHMGSPVVTATGVFGQVTAVSIDESHVMRVTDLRSAIPVKDEQTGWQGIAEGNGKNGLRLRHVLPGTAVHVGDRLVTSGLGHVFPVGLPVAVITQLQEHHPFSAIELTPVGELCSVVLIVELPHVSS